MNNVRTKEELEQAIKAKEIDIYLEGPILKEVRKANARAMLVFVIGGVIAIACGIVLVFVLPSDSTTHNHLGTTIVKAILYCGGAVLLFGLWMKQFKGFDIECLPDGQVRIKNS